jgi:phospholipid/cholesterol/gamma-HCH transport system ATP-binding protein
VAEVSAISDRIYLIAEGKVIEQGSPAQLQQSSSQWAQQFLHGMPDGPVPFHYPAIPFADELMASA